MPISLVINELQAQKLLAAGRDRSTGVEVSLKTAQRILHTNMGAHSLVAALPDDVALRCYAPNDEPKESHLIIFARKRLEDIQEGTYKAKQDELEH